jgi:lipoprotein-releasing system permease protein
MGYKLLGGFPFFIARRYLFSKKSHHAINIISGISVCGVVIATAALICTLSVFNGFQDMVASFFTSFDPQLKITPAVGKTAPSDDKQIQAIRNNKNVAVFTQCLEDNALVSYQDRQLMVTVKGVEDNFNKLTDFDKILYGNGSFVLHADVLNYGILGIQLCRELGLDTDFTDPLQVYAPKPGGQVDMANPAASFNHDELNSPGVVFSVKQSKYDANYVVTSLAFARSLFGQEGRFSSVELRLKDGADVQQVKQELRQTLGSKYVVRDRYEQQEDVFRIMKVEKLIAYLFLTFILMVACFNIIGSLSMLIIDKKEDVVTLRNMGATDRQITHIFMFEGRLISTFGAILGIALGLFLCWLQQTYGLIRLGNSSGNFVIDAYPVSVHIWDVVIVFFTVVLVGYASVWYPVRYLSRRLL